MCARLERDDRRSEDAVGATPCRDLQQPSNYGGSAASGVTPATETDDTGAGNVDVGGVLKAAAPRGDEGGPAMLKALAAGGTSTGRPRVQMDLWHVLHRLVEPAHVANGGYGPWCYSLSKAFSIPNPELLSELKAVVKKRHLTWSDKDVGRSLYGQYASARHRHVPTVVPPPALLLERFERVVAAFRPVKDIKTGAAEREDTC